VNRPPDVLSAFLCHLVCPSVADCASLAASLQQLANHHA
jgi:hypothetical protein